MRPASSGQAEIAAGTTVGYSARHRIYQIYYNAQTQAENDLGFLQLDNLANERPDWAEYWPIRRFLSSNELEDDVYYAFLSPKFGQKTGLAATAVLDFLDAAREDVVSFSPFFDQSAFAINVFEQAASMHRGTYPAFLEAFQRLDSSVDIQNLVMTSRNTVYCNYFAAKKHVWQRWFDHCETIFSICEAGESSAARMLNAATNYLGARYPTKVFVVERMISYLLATTRSWSVRSYNPLKLPFGSSRVAKFRSELLKLDALKIAYFETGFVEYLHVFGEIRAEINRKIGA
jgi:hypothetical protein